MITCLLSFLRNSVLIGPDIKTKKDKDTSKTISKVEPEDIIKFGLIPELVGRLPVVATLDELKKEDLVRILTEPKNALTKQYANAFNYRLSVSPALTLWCSLRRAKRKGLRKLMAQPTLQTCSTTCLIC